YYSHYTLTWDDKLASARTGLVKAARTLDPSCGRLMTHARGKIQDEMGRAVEGANCLERLPVVDMPADHREAIGLGSVTPDLSLDTPIRATSFDYSGDDEQGGFNGHDIETDDDQNLERDRALLREAADAVLDGREHDVYFGSLNDRGYDRFAKEWSVTPQRV